MRVRTHHSLLLALALLLGQWLAFAHELQHPALGADVDCQLCVHAHNLASGAPAAAAAQAFAQYTQESPAAATPVAVVAAQRRLHPIRGPPEAQA
ncbi:hypothetical protein C3942_03395 [Solimonas fluminis]|uniref:Uncharacterized protein n=1 Tax=Solimonas fluminis TaxID=2086571 RepID=A0A2S5TLT8_9GAMM|nr:hypothetical protein [Solimonas fluminis]PPE75939.1 hypothetical protein C3942_03395 [Solimonas fluminis]